jgi:hypothetical protein
VGAVPFGRLGPSAGASHTVHLCRREEEATPSGVLGAHTSKRRVCANPLGDVKGQPPLNLRYGVFVARRGVNGPAEHMDFKPTETYTVRSEAPMEFRDAPYSHLASVERPQINGRITGYNTLLTGPLRVSAATRVAAPITYNYKTREFLQAGSPVAGRKGKAVVVGGLTTNGGYSDLFGRSAGGWIGSVGGAAHSGSGGGGSRGSSSGGSGSGSRGSSNGGGSGSRSSSGGASSGGGGGSGGGSRGGGSSSGSGGSSSATGRRR